MTTHWIDIDKAGKWTLRAEVVGFRLIRGTHAGSNLGRYFVGLCNRVGIMSRSHSKVHHIKCVRVGCDLTDCDPAVHRNARQYLIQQHFLSNYQVSAPPPSAACLVSNSKPTAVRIANVTIIQCGD